MTAAVSPQSPAAGEVAGFPLVFVGGCPRSGTTLLRALLDSHPDVVCGPELRFLRPVASLCANMRRDVGGVLARHYAIAPDAFDDVFKTLILEFLAPLREKTGKCIIAEKTPANALYFGELSRLFPDARFIQIVRDGRDAVASLLTMDWTDHRTGARLDMTTSAAAAARAWVDHVRAGRLASKGGRYLEMRYEALVDDPEATMREVLAFLELPWSDDVLAFAENPSLAAGRNESSAAQVTRGIERNGLSRWTRSLTIEDKAAVKTVAGDLLMELGYADDDRW